MRTGRHRDHVKDSGIQQLLKCSACQPLLEREGYGGREGRKQGKEGVGRYLIVTLRKEKKQLRETFQNY